MGRGTNRFVLDGRKHSLQQAMKLQIPDPNFRETSNCKMRPFAAVTKTALMKTCRKVEGSLNLEQLGARYENH
jgi:hypothetical protein